MDGNDTLVAAVDGKAAKQLFAESDHPLLMLNVFVHDIKATLDQWSVRGDKTSEPGCLKVHLESLFKKYPALRLLTGEDLPSRRTELPLDDATRKMAASLPILLTPEDLDHLVRDYWQVGCVLRIDKPDRRLKACIW